MKEKSIAIDENIHQSTRLRIMTLLVSLPDSDRLAHGFIRETLGLTAGNLTIHLRKLEDAGYVSIAKEFVEVQPRTWVRATPNGRRAFAKYLGNLKRIIDSHPR